MAENSKIEWCDHTMNFWIGCQEVSPACDFCYARVQNEHWKWVNGWGPGGERRRTSASNWHKLRVWNRKAGERGIREKVFSNSLSDFFDNHKSVATARREAWHYIEQSPNLDFLLLTKRPQNIPKMLPDPETGVKPWGDGWPNVWLGTTVENQEEADRRIPHLLAVPARVRFLSCEPLLGPVDMLRTPRAGDTWDWLTGERENSGGKTNTASIDWVICGGESGPKSRPTHPRWEESLRAQCSDAGVPYFRKQWGDWHPHGETLADGSINALGNPDQRDKWHTFEDGATMWRVGKHRSGALLDGVAHRGMP